MRMRAQQNWVVFGSQGIRRVAHPALELDVTFEMQNPLPIMCENEQDQQGSIGGSWCDEEVDLGHRQRLVMRGIGGIARRSRLVALAFGGGARDQFITPHRRVPVNLIQARSYLRLHRRWAGNWFGCLGGNPAARDAEHNSVVTARDACRGRGAPIVQPGGKVLGRVLQRLFGGGRDDRRGQRRGTLYDFHELAELLLDFRMASLRASRVAAAALSASRLSARAGSVPSAVVVTIEEMFAPTH